uniref:Ubiquinone biosynthesis protein UbiV n=1 Tax=Candidatus Kentrum sp. UNK TaxID=2126344 RepID=A0A451B0A7_9GAMM|nr:MAG: Collagenase-like protease, PrtC family [Candidatus Kentron sp. UNK]VFK71715.1 MAG: Collagenase-like protease, PrtC family [Candidatus Kentron sp. UNK]
MKLSLAPIPYFWPEEAIRAFYDEIATCPVDIVYLGETICGKRHALSFDDWMQIGEQLTRAGKEVALSTLALLEAESELAALARICANGRFPVEANDMGAVYLLQDKDHANREILDHGNGEGSRGKGFDQSAESAIPGTQPNFVIGSHINAYNPETLSLLANLGAMRWVAPVELSRSTLIDLQKARPNGLQTEVLAYGRLPLAFSARCFAARAHNLPKDQCDFCCGNYPDGLALDTQEGGNLFTINGIQIQSAGQCNLLMATEDLSELQVDILRIVPQSQGARAVIHAFRDVLDGNATAPVAMDTLPPPGPAGWCNGFWLDEPGMVWNEAVLGEDPELGNRFS